MHIEESEVARTCGMYANGSRLNFILGSEGVKILPATQHETIGTGSRWFCVNMKPNDDLGVTLGVSSQIRLLSRRCGEYDNTSSSRRRTSDRQPTSEDAAARNHRKRSACAITGGEFLSSIYGAAPMELSSSSSSSSSSSFFYSQAAPLSRPRTKHKYDHPELAVMPDVTPLTHYQGFIVESNTFPTNLRFREFIVFHLS